MNAHMAMNTNISDQNNFQTAKSTGTALVVVDEEPGDSPDSSQARKTPGFLQRLAYLFSPQSNATIRENLQDALAFDNGSDTTISSEERAMLHNILRLREVRVVDVMIPRAEIEAVDMTTTLGELLELFETSGHSRMPVYFETLDDPRGMIHIRDVVAYLTRSGKVKSARRKAPLKNGRTSATTKPPVRAIDFNRIDLGQPISALKLTRDVLFVPPSMLASDLMARMQSQRIQMALVIDEYGGTDGLVSLEDIVEMVVGDIEDEHDDVETHIERVNDDTIIVDARVLMEELEPYLGKAFVNSALEEDDEVDTIGGLIFSIMGRVPVRGEVIPNFASHELEVLDADPRRIRRVRIKRLKPAGRRVIARRDAEASADTSNDKPVSVPQ